MELAYGKQRGIMSSIRKRWNQTSITNLKSRIKKKFFKFPKGELTVLPSAVMVFRINKLIKSVYQVAKHYNCF